MSFCVRQSFFGDLAERAGAGAARLPLAFRDRQLDCVERFRRRGGGFRGRDGASDLYYTGFAARVREMLGRADRDRGGELTAYVSRVRGEVRSLSDLVSLCELGRILGTTTAPTPGADSAAVRRRLACFRTRDGNGYARLRGGGWSTYGTFLAFTAAQLSGVPLPDPGGTLAFMQALQRPDGGFPETPEASASSTNPTAAGVVFLSENGALSPESAAAAARFLANMQSTDGGLQAHGSAPPDLLSTFTGLTALWRTGQASALRLGNLARFVRSLSLRDGGFRPTSLDSHTDPEYIYYGLAVLALLAAEVSDRSTRRGPHFLQSAPGESR